MKNAKQNLIIISMGSVVPANAIGYVAGLAASNPHPKFELDCLRQLHRYCPELVVEYIKSDDSRDAEKQNEMWY